MLNLDTHMLVYLLAGELTQKELDALEKEELAISDIVLWELSKLVQMKRLELDFKSDAFEALLLNLTVFPITLPIALASTKLDFRGDPADEIIAATSIVEGVPLLTRDRAIRKSKRVPFAIS
jgi:PIN domain nuclease of toxin-antitoxin system